MKGIMSGLVCLITGASRGIGKAIALAYAKENANLILCATNQKLLDNVAKECLESNAESCKTFVADFNTLEGIKALTDQLKSNSITEIDVLVNNAGIFSHDNATSDCNTEKWLNVLSVNLLAPMHLTCYCTPYMVAKKAGTIINIGSVAGIIPSQMFGVYSTSKYGLNGYSHHTYEHLKQHNIKVMLINPSFTSTDMVSKRAIELDKVVQPADVGEVALLPFKTTPGCCPESITLSTTGNVYKKQ